MTSTAELLQAEAELWCHAFGYLKSMALQCAIKLGIPNAIHRSGGTASLPELHAALPVAASKRSCVSRIMTFLAASGIFSEESPAAAADGEVAAGVRYSLTPASRLLVDDDDSVTSGSHHTCLSQFMLLCCSPINFRASQSLDDWLRVDELDGDNHAAAAAAETPFMMANGASLYGLTSRDAEFGARFSEGMGSDSRFVAEILARGGCAPVFAGLTSLVDVGGGDGTTARAIARAYPHVRCSVLELPEVVVDAVPADGGAVEFVAGDMMEYIPPADAVLLKFVLHNWSDEECVRILKLSKEAISTREPKGKAVQVYYTRYANQAKQELQGWAIVHQVSPHGKLPAPNDDDYNFNTNTYDGEFYQEDGLSGTLQILLPQALEMEEDNETVDDEDDGDVVQNAKDIQMLERLLVAGDEDEDDDVGPSDSVAYLDNIDSDDETYNPNHEDYS